jgi:uncharacterized protein YjbI with pentapeptide repeats
MRARLLTLALVAVFAGAAEAQIYQWEWVDPEHPELGKQQSSTLCPDGAGLTVGDYSRFSYIDLTKAYLIGSNAVRAGFNYSTLIDADLSHSVLPGVGFQQTDLTGATLREAVLEDVTLLLAVLTNADFTNSNLQNASLGRATGVGVIMRGVDLSGSSGGNISRISLTDSDFRHANLNAFYALGATFDGTNFDGADFTDAFLQTGSFKRASFDGATFRGANFKYTSFDNADLTGADIAGSIRMDLTWSQMVTTASYKNRNLAKTDFSELTITGWNFAGQNLRGCTFHRSDMRNMVFDNADITGATFTWVTNTGFTASMLYETANYRAGDLSGLQLTANNLSGWNFRNQDLSGANLQGSQLTNADFTDAIISGADFSTTHGGLSPGQIYTTASYKTGQMQNVRLSYHDLTGCDLSGKDLSGSKFYLGNLTDADMSGAKLSRANFQGATLAGVSFAGADLTNAFMPVDLSTADFTNAVIRGASINGTIGYAGLAGTASFKAGDLREIGIGGLGGWDLRNLNLQRSSLGSAVGTDFSGSDLRLARFSGDAAGANFTGANLAGVIMNYRDLTGTNFRNAKLNRAHFSNANLCTADFEGADVRYANFNTTVSSEALTLAQLVSTASYQNRTLRGVRLPFDIGPQDLSNFDLRDSQLGNVHGVNVTGAMISGMTLYCHDREGFSAEQLYSTASYQAGDLRNTRFVKYVNGWDLSGQDLRGADFGMARMYQTDFTDADIRGARFGSSNYGEYDELSGQQLQSTISYKNGDLTGIILESHDLDGWNFANQNLTSAQFTNCSLAGTDFANAVIRGTRLRWSVGRGFTEAQLKSTASYQDQDLRELDLGSNDLSGWDFSNQDLTNASLAGATLDGADFTGAILDGVYMGGSTDLDVTKAASTRNMIWPDGTIKGLELSAGDTLNIPWRVRISDCATLDEGSEIRVTYSGGSGIVQFDAGIPVTLGGTLVLTTDFTPDSLSDYVGQQFKLFDWAGEFNHVIGKEGGVDPIGTFDHIDGDGYAWDVRKLYTTGEVRFLGVPEPGTLTLVTAGAVALLRRRRRRRR